MQNPTYLVAISSSCQMYSGTGTALMDFLSVNRDRFSFTVATDSRDHANWRLLADFCDSMQIPIFILPHNEKPGCIDSGILGVTQVIHANDWDVIELISWASASTNQHVVRALARPKKKRPVLVFTPHSQPINTIPSPDMYYSTSPVFRETLLASDLILIDSEAETLLPDFEGIDAQRIALSKLGVNTEVFSPQANAKIPSRSERDFLLCVCDCRESRKRIDLLLNASQKILAEHQDIQLVIAGKGSNEITIPSDLNAGRVELLGYVSRQELIRLYRACASFILLSDYEAFGLPIAEALCCGAPVILNKIPVLESLFNGMPGVELVNNLDVEEISAAFKRNLGLGAGERKLIANSAFNAYDSTKNYREKANKIIDIAQSFRNTANSRAHANIRIPATIKDDSFSLKIAHISPSYFSPDSVIGGGEKYINYMIKSTTIAEPLHRSDLIVPGPADQSFDYLPGSRLEVVHSTGGSSFTLPQLQSRVRQYDVVIIHQCISEFGFDSAAVAKDLNKLVIGMDHGGGRDSYADFYGIEGKLFDVVIAQSDFALTDIMRLARTSAVIKGPVDTTFFWPASPNQGKLYSNPYVLTVGRVLPHKGFESVIQAISGADIEYRILGAKYDKEYLSYLENLANDLGVKLEVASDVNDATVRRIMQGASAYIHPSLHFDYKDRYYPKPELLGLAPLESLACGVRTFVSTAGALPELAINRGCTVFANTEDLRDKILPILSSPVDSEEAILISREVNKRYGLHAFGTQLVKTIQVAYLNHLRHFQALGQ